MKIGHSAELSASTSTAGTTASNAAATTSQASTTAAQAIPATADPSAKIELSSTASSLLTKSSSPEFDAEKVDRMSKANENGTFTIDAGAIADKLISNAHELLAKVSP